MSSGGKIAPVENGCSRCFKIHTHSARINGKVRDYWAFGGWFGKDEGNSLQEKRSYVSRTSKLRKEKKALLWIHSIWIVKVQRPTCRQCFWVPLSLPFSNYNIISQLVGIYSLYILTVGSVYTHCWKRESSIDSTWKETGWRQRKQSMWWKMGLGSWRHWQQVEGSQIVGKEPGVLLRNLGLSSWGGGSIMIPGKLSNVSVGF